MAKTTVGVVIAPLAVVTVHFPGTEDSDTEVTGVQVCRLSPRSRQVLITCAATFQGYNEAASQENTETAFLIRERCVKSGLRSCAYR